MTDTKTWRAWYTSWTNERWTFVYPEGEEGADKSIASQRAKDFPTFAEWLIIHRLNAQLSSLHSIEDKLAKENRRLL